MPIRHKFNEPVWATMHKIRKSIDKRDDRYILTDMIEFDEGYFEVETSEKEQENLWIYFFFGIKKTSLLNQFFDIFVWKDYFVSSLLLGCVCFFTICADFYR